MFLKFCLLAATLLIILFTPFDAVASDNLLSNSDFEDWDENGPTGWEKYSNTNFSLSPITDSSKIKSGSKALLINVNTDSYKFIYNRVEVISGQKYRFSGYAKLLEGTSSIVLRMAWYCSGCTSQLSTNDSVAITHISNDYEPMIVEAVAPTNAAQLRARVVLTPTNDSNTNIALIDNLYLEKIETTSPSTSPSPTVGITPSPSVVEKQINWTVGNSLRINSEFVVGISLLEFESDTNYYLKIRGGLDQNTLNKLTTKSEDDFFTDTAGWSNFPLIKTDSSGKWSGNITGNISDTHGAGKYYLVIRVHNKDTGSNKDSDAKLLDFNEAIINPTPTALPVTNTNPVFSSSKVLGQSITRSNTASYSDYVIDLSTHSGFITSTSEAEPLGLNQSGVLLVKTMPAIEGKDLLISLGLGLLVGLGLLAKIKFIR